MEVILREDIDKLGHRGEVVKVAAGLRAQLSAAAEIGCSRHRLEQENCGAGAPGTSPARGQGENRRGGAGEADEPGEVTIAQKAGDNDQLFGSVTAGDIVAALEKQGYTVDRRKVQLDEPIKQLGDYKVSVKLHREVSIELPVHVIREE